MISQIQIGNVAIPQTAALAPMAGVADRAFRELCCRFGACYCVGEMVSAKGLNQGSRKSAQLLEIGASERPGAIQLFGDSPDDLARAVEFAMRANPDIIDINMGCPAPKIAGNGGGSALMRHPELAAEIIRRVKQASPVPVTVKFRKGWDEQSINGVEFAIMAEQAGADAITIHGRTRAQMYAPSADWNFIHQVKQAVSIPVIGNGDVNSPQSAEALYKISGCDLVMIGRGALGRPWLFKQISAYFAAGELLPEPSWEERMQVMLEQITLAIRYKGESVALREARKHCGWYLSGLRGAAALRRQAGMISSVDDLHRLAEDTLKAAYHA